jgi:hypothetical protein
LQSYKTLCNIFSTAIPPGLKEKKMTIEQAQKVLQDLLAKGVPSHEALQYAANQAASKRLSYWDAKQMLLFLQFGI